MFSICAFVMSVYVGYLVYVKFFINTAYQLVLFIVSLCFAVMALLFFIGTLSDILTMELPFNKSKKVFKGLPYNMVKMVVRVDKELLRVFVRDYKGIVTDNVYYGKDIKELYISESRKLISIHLFDERVVDLSDLFSKFDFQFTVGKLILLCEKAVYVDDIIKEEVKEEIKADLNKGTDGVEEVTEVGSEAKEVGTEGYESETKADVPEEQGTVEVENESTVKEQEVQGTKQEEVSEELKEVNEKED